MAKNNPIVSAPVEGHIEKAPNTIDRQYIKKFGSDAYIATMFDYGLNQESAREQMAFQEYMSSSAHQREVADLVSAGLNPILSANNGAATGAGAYASTDTSATSAKYQDRMLNKQIKMNKDLAKLERKQQLKIAREQIESQQFMNKYSTDMSYALGTLQSQNALYGAMYGADASASAMRYSAGAAAAAAMYGADQSRAAMEFSAQKQYDASTENSKRTTSYNRWNSWNQRLHEKWLQLNQQSWKSTRPSNWTEAWFYPWANTFNE